MCIRSEQRLSDRETRPPVTLFGGHQIKQEGAKLSKAKIVSMLNNNL